MPDERTEKSRAIDLAVSQIEKQFGKGAIMRLGGIDSSLALDAIPSGSLSLDAALGVGGFPRGRVIEIFGPEKPLARRRDRPETPHRWFVAAAQALVPLQSGSHRQHL